MRRTEGNSRSFCRSWGEEMRGLEERGGDEDRLFTSYSNPTHVQWESLLFCQLWSFFSHSTSPLQIENVNVPETNFQEKSNENRSLIPGWLLSVGDKTHQWHIMRCVCGDGAGKADEKVHLGLAGWFVPRDRVLFHQHWCLEHSR